MILRIILIATTVLAVAACSKPANEKLTVPMVVDIGEVQTNEIKTAKFAVENQSDIPITLQKLSTTCACTSVFLEGDKQLSPHSRRNVTASINFGDVTGSHVTKITLDSDVGNGKITKEAVFVQGTVVSSLLLFDPLINYREVNQTSGKRKMVARARQGNAKETWNSLIFEDCGDNLKLSAERTSDIEWNIILWLDPSEMPIATFRHQVKVRLANNGDILPGYFPLTVTAKVTGPLKPEPSTIYTGVVAPSSNIDRSIRLSSSVQNMGHLVASCDSPEVEIHVDESAQSYTTIGVHMVAPSQKGPFAHKLFISADNPNSKLVIDLFGMVQSP